MASAAIRPGALRAASPGPGRRVLNDAIKVGEIGVPRVAHGMGDVAHRLEPCQRRTGRVEPGRGRARPTLQRLRNAADARERTGRSTMCSGSRRSQTDRSRDTLRSARKSQRPPERRRPERFFARVSQSGAAAIAARAIGALSAQLSGQFTEGGFCKGHGRIRVLQLHSNWPAATDRDIEPPSTRTRSPAGRVVASRTGPAPGTQRQVGRTLRNDSGDANLLATWWPIWAAFTGLMRSVW